MLKNYFIVAFRNLTKNKLSAAINIGGLAVGMAVALLIGLWIHDELSFNKTFDNYNRIGKLWQFVKFGPEKSSYDVMPIPLAADLRNRFPDFKYVCLSATQNSTLESGDKKLTPQGLYAEPDMSEMLSLHMVQGSRDLHQENTMLLSASMAKAMFGNENPIGRNVKINNQSNATVTGVFADFPTNNTFSDVQFFAPWNLYLAIDGFPRDNVDQWDNNSWQIYAQLKPGADFAALSAKIRNARTRRNNPPKYNPEFFVFPMSRWHLYGDFRDGVNTGGTITFVWLFGIIGSFVLLLACINFMNLSTARSERRAKEVGIRKAIGSLRGHLIWQFLAESILVAIIAFGLAILLAELIMPFFNYLSDKHMHLLWNQPWFWIAGLGFTLFTGLIAGSYPALYLSSFRPVKVLKGTFKAGPLAAIPRKVLVVVQFTVSVSLIIGTIIVFRQIQYAKSRDLGYTQGGLIQMQVSGDNLNLLHHFSALRDQLIHSGAATGVSASSTSLANATGGTTDFKWQGKDPNVRPLFMSNSITADFGHTVGWRLVAGEDFSGDFARDSGKMIINEATVKLIGFKNPIGEIITRNNGKDHYTIIGVVHDLVAESPFEQVKPSFYLADKNVSWIVIRLNPQQPTADAISKIGTVVKSIDPANPFSYDFVSAAFGKKFDAVERLGKMAGFFTLLAILISCLGLFGLVSFVAEQRTREIGVRKVLGATVLNVWGLLSKEFIILVSISCCIAIPLAYHYMKIWLEGSFDSVRTPLSWWIFAGAALGATVITLATISVQAIKAALSSPVKALRSE